MKNLTGTGIIILVIGLIMSIVGLILFGSVFFGMFNNDPFNDMGFHSGPGFSANPFGGGGFPPVGRAFVGVILVGFGDLLVKVGLGMGVVGSSDQIARWAGKTFRSGIEAALDEEDHGHKEDHEQDYEHEETMFCRACGKKIPADSIFCPRCGKRLTEEA